MHRSLVFLLCFTSAAVVGCQQQEKLNIANVKGTVTFNGKPLEKGTITFVVEDKLPLPAEIVDGKYAGTAVVGQNRIIISAKRKSAAAKRIPKEAESQIKWYKEHMRDKVEKPIDFDPTLVEIMPPEWGAQSKQTRLVESGQTNEFDFNIKKD
jgi:hypothetical protein